MSLYLIFIKNNMDADNIIQKKNADVQFTRSESLEEITCVLSHKQGSVFTAALETDPEDRENTSVHPAV